MCLSLIVERSLQWMARRRMNGLLSVVALHAYVLWCDGSQVGSYSIPISDIMNRSFTWPGLSLHWLFVLDSNSDAIFMIVQFLYKIYISATTSPVQSHRTSLTIHWICHVHIFWRWSGWCPSPLAPQIDSLWLDITRLLRFLFVAVVGMVCDCSFIRNV